MMLTQGDVGKRKSFVFAQGLAHLLLRTNIKIQNIPAGHVFWIKSNPYDSSGHADTAKLHRITEFLKYAQEDGTTPHHNQTLRGTTYDCSQMSHKCSELFSATTSMSYHVTPFLQTGLMYFNSNFISL